MIKDHSNLDDSGNLFFIDVETTGSCPLSNGINQFGLTVVNSDLEIIDTYSANVRPPMLNHKTWSKGAEEIHKITFEETMSFMSNKDFCLELLWFMKKYKHKNNLPLKFVCHASENKFFNAEEKEMVMGWIDYNFLEWAFKKEGFEDSFWKIFSEQNRVSTLTMCNKMGFKKNKLKHWIERLGLDLNNHNALDDSIATFHLYKYIVNYTGANGPLFA